MPALDNEHLVQNQSSRRSSQQDMENFHFYFTDLVIYTGGGQSSVAKNQRIWKKPK
jgi:hypothetical protein